MEKLETKEDFLKCRRKELLSIIYTKRNIQEFKPGIEGLIEYRKHNYKIHPDSIEKERYGTLKYFKMIYGDSEIFESSDTIFNCWVFFRMFLNGKEKFKKYNYDEILENLTIIFEGNEDIKESLDKLANYHHSIANFMPAPKCFNGFNKHQKGGCYSDNDMPNLYYNKLKQNENTNCKCKCMKEWIDKNVEKYKLHFFYEYKNELKTNKLNFNNKEEINNFKNSIENAIKCIENRAEKLFEIYKNNK